VSNLYIVNYCGGTFGTSLVYFISQHSGFRHNKLVEDYDKDGNVVPHFYCREVKPTYVNNSDLQECARFKIHSTYPDICMDRDDMIPIIINPTPRAVKRAKRRMKEIVKMKWPLARHDTIDMVNKSRNGILEIIENLTKRKKSFHVVDIDKLFNKDETEYEKLCNFCNTEKLDNWKDMISTITDHVKFADK
jgi:hypothetical protein